MDLLEKIKSKFSDSEQKVIERFLHKASEGFEANQTDKQKTFGTPVEIKEIGEMNLGAPNPIILSNEYRLSIAFYLNITADWDGTTCKMRNPKEDYEPLAIVNMSGVYEFCQRENGINHEVVGVPYDLCESVWAIEDSGKAKRLSDGGSSSQYKHIIFGFHDSTVECLCLDYEILHVKSTVYDAIEKQRNFIFGDE